MKTTITCSTCGALNEIDLDQKILSQFQKEVRKDLEMEYKRKKQELADLLERNKSEIKEQTRQESYLKIKEKEKLISDLKTQLTKVQEKLDNSSQQLVGEVQELQLESILSSFGKVEPVPKGIRGGDCILRFTSSDIEIGSILWESKRVKTFSDGWLDKALDDSLRAKCSLAIVTCSTLPKDFVGKFGIRKGVWICLFEPEVIRQLTLVLQYGLLKVYEITQKQKLSAVNSEKLFRYLTSSEFENLFSNVLKKFNELNESFQQERKQLTAHWALRDQHLKSILESTLEMYGNLRGISPEISEIKTLSLPQAD